MSPKSFLSRLAGQGLLYALSGLKKDMVYFWVKDFGGRGGGGGVLGGVGWGVLRAVVGKMTIFEF
jgi:hypothetical protein